MGCSASVQVPQHPAVSGSQPSGAPASHSALPQKPLEEWSEEEVESWMRSLHANLSQHAPTLLPASGKLIAAWDNQLLEDAGVSNGYHRKQLLTARDGAADKSAAFSSASQLQRASPSPMAPAAGAPSAAIAAAAGKGDATAAAQSPQLNDGVAGVASWSKVIGGKLLVLARKGLPAAQTGLAKLGEVLPFPGSTACATLSVVLGLIDTALLNNDKIRDLALRAVDLLDIVVESQPQFDAQSGAFVRIMSRFNDLLMEIQSYARDYAGRNALLRGITAIGDKDQWQEMCQVLADLRGDATLAVAAKTHGAVLEMHSELKDVGARINTMADGLTQLVGDKAKVQVAIDACGGEAAVLADPARRREVLKALSIEDKLRQAALDSVAAAMDSGVHRIIKHPDLRVFWHTFYAGKEKVEWPLWWEQFPAELSEAAPQLPEGDIASLTQELSTEEARRVFQAAVDRRDPEHISVDEIKLAFPQDSDLLQRTRSFLEQAAGGTTSSTATAGTAVVASSSAATHVSLVSLGVNLPALDPLYVEREGGYADALLARLSLQGGPTRCLCLVGGAGLGKSGIALDLSWRLLKQGLLPGGAKLVDLRDARSAAHMEARFCAALEVEQGSDARAAMLARLGAIEASAGACLLLVDNAEDTLCGPEPDALPTLLDKVVFTASKAVLLVTSRQSLPEASGRDSSASATASNVDLAVLQPEAARKLICSVASAQLLSRADVEEVAAVCGGNPLLLRVIADALASGRITLTAVQDAARRMADPSSPGQPGDCDSSSAAVVATVGLTIAALPDQRLQEALAQLSVFPCGWEPEGAAAVLACHEGRSNALVQQLYRHGLVLYDSSTARYYLHPAVRQAAADTSRQVVGGAEERFAHFMVLQMAEWAALCATSAVHLALQQGRQHEADITKLLQLVTAPDGPAGLQAAAAKLACMPCAYRYLTVLGRVKEAQPAIQRGMDVCNHTLGPEHPDTLDSVNALAVCYKALGRSSEALPLHERALEARERTLGPEHPDTLYSVHYMAGCYKALGRSAEALPLYERALGARERTLGPEHPDTLYSVHNLADCYRSLGRSSEALPLYDRALGARERTLGPEHTDTLYSVNSLAVCYRVLGRSAEALPLHERVLGAYERTLGPEHPDTLNSVNSLADCYKALGRSSEALPLYERVLGARERTLGIEHPETLVSVHNLADCYKALGRSAEALTLYERALGARERTLGPAHPDTLYSVHSLAGCYKALGRSSEALALYERALGARERTLGPEHPDTLYSVHNLADCYKALGRSTEALPLYERALGARERTLGPEHPDTLYSVNSLAVCLRVLGRSAEALPLHERVLGAYERTLGPEHPDTLVSVHSLADCYKALGRSTEALPLYERALGARERTLGPEHPETLVSVQNLAGCHMALGCVSDASALYIKYPNAKH